jgi:hypothetical protein
MLFGPICIIFTPLLKTLTNVIDQAYMHWVTLDEAIAKAEVYIYCYHDQLFVSISCNVIIFFTGPETGWVFSRFSKNTFSLKTKQWNQIYFGGLLIQYGYESRWYKEKVDLASYFNRMDKRKWYHYFWNFPFCLLQFSNIKNRNHVNKSRNSSLLDTHSGGRPKAVQRLVRWWNVLWTPGNIQTYLGYCVTPSNYGLNRW